MNVQGRVVERNQKLEEMENQVSSFKNVLRCKEDEVARLQKELENTRDECRDVQETKDEGLEKVKREMEKTGVCLKSMCQKSCFAKVKKPFPYDQTFILRIRGRYTAVEEWVGRI